MCKRMGRVSCLCLGTGPPNVSGGCAGRNCNTLKVLLYNKNDVLKTIPTVFVITERLTYRTQEEVNIDILTRAITFAWPIIVFHEISDCNSSIIMIESFCYG